MNYKLVNYSARNCKKIIPSNLLTSIAAAGTKANTQQIPPINRCQTPSILGHWSPEEVGPRLRKNIWWMFCNSWMGSMWWERGFARWSSFLVKIAMRAKQIRQMRAPLLDATERRRRLSLILQKRKWFFSFPGLFPARARSPCPSPREWTRRTSSYEWPYSDRIT